LAHKGNARRNSLEPLDRPFSGQNRELLL